MGIFDFLTANPAQEQKAALQRQQQVQTETARSINAYIRSIFRFFGNDQPIDLKDDSGVFIKSGYKSVPAVYSGVSLILNKLAACPILTYEVIDEQGLKAYNNLKNSPVMEQKIKGMLLKERVLKETSHKDIQQILDKPNNMQHITEVVQHIGGSLILAGDNFIYRNGSDPENNKYSEIFVLPSQVTTIISGGINQPVKGYKVSYSDDMLPANQVVHTKTYNPDWSLNGAQLYGQSSFTASLRTLARAELGDKEVNKQLKNGGTIGVVGPKNKVDEWTKDQGDAFKERLRDAKSSDDEVARVVAAAVALDFTQIGLSLADMQLLELLKLTDEQIYRALHIPLQYLNQEGSSYNNKSEAGKELIYNALEPVARGISTALTRAICDPVFERTGKRYIITLDTSSLPEMAADMKEIAEWLEKSSELTLNERREVKGWSRLEMENMDVPLVSKNLVPVTMLHLTPDTFNQAAENEAQ